MNTRFTLTALLGSLALAGSATAATPVEVFLEGDLTAVNAGATFLDTVATSGGTAYVFMRDTAAATDVGYIFSFDGVSFTTVMDETDWATTGSTFDMAAGNGAGIAGGNARFVSFFENNVYDVNLGTGAPTEVVSKAALDAAAGVSVNMTAVFEVLPSGQIYAVDSVSDQVLAISPGNAVSVEINTADFATLLGGTSIGGIGVAGDTILIGSNSDDQLVAWNTVTNTGSVVLTEAQIEAATDDVDGNAGFGDIFFAPDGLVYFYESDSDHLLSYDPADPAGTLTAVVTEQEFTDGPSSDTINQLAWWDGNIAYTDGGIGFYVVPEPTSLALLGLGGLLVARRRR